MRRVESALEINVRNVAFFGAKLEERFSFEPSGMVLIWVANEEAKALRNGRSYFTTFSLVRTGRCLLPLDGDLPVLLLTSLEHRRK